MSETAWRDVTPDCLRDEGGERWLRAIDDECWISVLHRMTGFGYMEWETFIVFRIADGSRPKLWPTEDKDTLIIPGDWRDELAEMPKERLRSWYDENIGAELRARAALRHALGVARHEIARLTAERDAALRELQAGRVGRCQPPAAPQPASVSDAQAAMDQDRAVVQRQCAAEQAADSPPAAPQPATQPAGWLTDEGRRLLEGIMESASAFPPTMHFQSGFSVRDALRVMEAILSCAGSPPVVQGDVREVTS